MTRKQKRLSVIGGALLFLGAASGLTLYALGSKASFFIPRRRIWCKSGVAEGKRFRLFGLNGRRLTIRAPARLGGGLSVTYEVHMVQVVL